MDVTRCKMHLTATRSEFTAKPTISSSALEIVPIHHPLCFWFILQARQVILHCGGESFLGPLNQRAVYSFSPKASVCQLLLDLPRFLLECFPPAGKAAREQQSLLGVLPGPGRPPRLVHITRVMANEVPFRWRHPGEDKGTLSNSWGLESGEPSLFPFICSLFRIQNINLIFFFEDFSDQHSKIQSVSLAWNLIHSKYWIPFWMNNWVENIRNIFL